jgi:osmotically-inducible protein OsmY
MAKSKEKQGGYMDVNSEQGQKTQDNSQARLQCSDVENGATAPICLAKYKAYRKTIPTMDRGRSAQPLKVYFPDPEPSCQDGMIYSRVIFALFSDGTIDDTHIGICVKDGLVTLSGTVHSYYQKLLAGNIAQQQHGAHAVANKLEVRHTSDFINNTIAENVRAVLDNYGLADPRDVAVKICRGVATITGTAFSAKSKASVRQAVLKTPGVTEVINRLTVRGKRI